MRKLLLSLYYYIYPLNYLFDLSMNNQKSFEIQFKTQNTVSGFICATSNHSIQKVIQSLLIAGLVPKIKDFFVFYVKFFSLAIGNPL